MKIAGIQFPEPLLAALRDGRLVVFAGAGVSMGAPARLPSFTDLTQLIATDTGKALQEGKPEDCFLGKLQHARIDVHKRAARALTRDGLAPTDLHIDLLRLYSDVRRVKIVTTNFDLLFEQAADDVFGSKPEVFRAPALPLGKNFNGIIHVHGAVNRPDEMVLTDADFGRGYLTEGWARRFLVDLFRHFTVLFVGYSHNDTIMNYLARALPESEAGQRFALTEEDAPQRWQVLGIEPIEYPKRSMHDHSALYEGVSRLADTVRRNVLDWQREVTELAEKPPSMDEEETYIIEDALKNVVTTRFFTDAARLPEWLEWLDKRKYLEELFGSGSLSERGTMLARWLAAHFAYRCADDLFLLIARHKMCLHPGFRWILGQEIGLVEQDSPDEKVLSRWISVLLATVPDGVDQNVLLWIGGLCVKQGMLESLLQVFDAMAGSCLQLKPGFSWPNDEDNDPSPKIKVDLPLRGDHYSLNKLWETGLKPNMAEVAEPLLGRVVSRLEEQHFTLRAWQKASSEWDSPSWRRSAIEPHEQDKYPEAIDILIDAARDSLDWLAVNQEEVAARWCVKIAESEVPLLRRLAVHTLSVRTDLMADEKIEWLLEHIDLHDLSAHHEVFRAVQLAYPEASSGHRVKVMDAVLAYRWPDEKDSEKERRAARHRFNWLDWLHRVAPDCELTKQALDDVLEQYPEFKPSEHPDLTHWTTGPSWAGPRSPWTAEELLAKPAVDWLPELLSFQPTEFLGSDRDGLVLTIAEAVKRRFAWGGDLADALAAAEEWDSDIWSGLIRAWSEMELDEDRHREVLQRLGSADLHSGHASEIADALYVLVKDDGKPYALNLLTQANEIAAALWHNLERGELPEEVDDWVQMAINHPAGILTKFWLGSLSLWRRQRDPVPKAFSDEYRQALSGVVQDLTLPGRLGRSVLVSQFAFLLAADEVWTKENLLPLFEVDEDVADFKAAWDGFLVWGRLNPSVAELLEGAFLQAIQRIESDLVHRRERFIEYYTTMLGYFVTAPLNTWVPDLFYYASKEVWRLFASNVAHHLRGMDEAHQKEWWQRWLKPYWENRLQGVPAALEPGEVEHMLDWLPHLTAIFPEAVNLAIRMPKTPLQHCSVIYELRKSELSQQYPEAVAQLLIHLGESESPGYMWDEGRELVDKLLQTDLSPKLEEGLNELIAKLGLT